MKQLVAVRRVIVIVKRLNPRTQDHCTRFEALIERDKGEIEREDRERKGERLSRASRTQDRCKRFEALIER